MVRRGKTKKGGLKMRPKTNAGVRKILSLLLIATFVAGVTSIALAKDDYPSRPLTIYVGYKIGATTGLTATVLGKILEDILGQPVAIVDKSGATATVAIGTVARLPADGYSMAVGSYSSIMTTPYQYDLPFDTKKDVEPLYAYTVYHSGFAVKADSPWKTVGEYLDWAKAHPGEAKWGSAGAMTFGHLVMEYLGYLKKIDWRPIGCKGGAASTKLLLGNQTNGIIMSSSQVPLIENGQLRYVLDFAHPQDPPIFAQFVKPEDLKNCQTLEQIGHPELAFVNPVIVYVRRGLPPDVRKKLIGAIQKATYDKRLSKVTDKFSMPVLHNGGDEFFAKTREPLEKLTKKLMTDMGRIKKK